MKTSKTVWHICSNRWNSAITEYCLSAAKSINFIQGYNSVVTCLENSPLEKRCKQSEIRSKTVRDFSLVRILRLRQIKNELKPDAIIFYGGSESFLGNFLGLGSSAQRYRFRGQDKDFTDSSKLSYKIKLKSQKKIDGIICPSEILRKKIESLVPSIPVEAIPLGLNTDQFYFLNKNYAEASRAPVLLILGRLDPIKGHFYFLDLFSKLITTLKNDHLNLLPLPKLKIIGCPENIKKEELLKYINTKNLSEYVTCHFHRVNNLNEILNETTLGIIPSLGSEVICRVSIEFQLCGVPLFVSGVGSLREVLVDSASMSYHNQNPKDLIQLLKKCIYHSFEESKDDKEKRARMTQDLFSLQAMAKEFKKLFEKH